MAILGFDDLKSTTLPTLWDEDYLTKARLQDGITLDKAMADVRIGLQALNGGLLNMQHYGSLIAVQDTIEVEYPNGVSNGFQEATEYGIPDPQLASTTGHMLPIKPYDRSMGWTMMRLRKMRMAQLDANIRSVFIDANQLWQQKILNRLFSTTANAVGTTSSDVPLADGGSADATYVPLISPDGEVFLYTHNHFLGYGTTGITQDTIDQSAVDVAIEHLQEHGHNGPFDLVGSRADAASWANTTTVTGWKSPLWQGINYQSSAVERAMVGGIEEYFGFIETDYGVVRVWLTSRVPTTNFAVYKAYGAGDPRNPLRVRIEPNIGFGFNLVPGNWTNAPTQLLIAYAEFGVGVGEDRTNGVAVDVAASTYSAPTIS